jgi:hypothetical protein
LRTNAAIAQALVAHRAQPWARDIANGPTMATVTVRQPEVKHTVKIQDFENWLNGVANSPADMVLNERLLRLSGTVR